MLATGNMLLQSSKHTELQAEVVTPIRIPVGIEHIDDLIGDLKQP